MKIAGIQIGGAMNFNDAAYQSALAKQSVMVLGYYPGIAPGGTTMDACVKAVKAINPSAIVFLYTSSDGEKVPAPTPYAALVAKVQAMNWWLKDASGKPVPSFFAGETTINNTPNTAPDELGYTSIDWITRWWAYNVASVPSADGIYHDNVFAAPRVPGDWTCTGVLQITDPKAQAALQAGYERYFALIRGLVPSKYQIGNIGSWTANGAAVPAGYVSMVDGGVLEALLGKSWSVETWGGWAKMMVQYRDTMAAVRSPKLVIFNQHGDATDYQSMRYGLCSCLLGDGYYSYTVEADGYYGVPWFDEYNAALGEPAWQPPSTPWSQGVWRRDYTGGIVLVNPKDNGQQTLQLEVPHLRLKGPQCPAVNTGQRVTSVTLADRDGLVLLK